jgi:prepilin-type processing-associated H-X9-DG protein
MLVVLTIIAVLAAILFPTISRMKAGARSTRCVGNLRQMASLIGIYMSENDGLLPYSAGYNHTGTGAISWGWDNHASPLAVLGGFGEGTTTRPWFDAPGEQHIFNCPAEPKLFRTYTANKNFMAFMPGGYVQRIQHSTINDPSRKILIADSIKQQADQTGFIWFDNATRSYIGDRHQGSANALFVDFHVESVKRSQLTTDNITR